MGDRAREKGRAAIYSMAGIYLLYLAYCMFRDRADSAGGEYTLIMAAMAAFVVIGIGLIGFSLKMLKDIHQKETEESKKDTPQQDE